MREIVLNESAPDYKEPFDSVRDPGKVKGPQAFRGGDPARDSVCACVSDRETAIVLLDRCSRVLGESHCFFLYTSSRKKLRERDGTEMALNGSIEKNAMESLL